MKINNYYIQDLDDFFYWLINFPFKKSLKRKEVTEYFHEKFKNLSDEESDYSIKYQEITDDLKGELSKKEELITLLEDRIVKLKLKIKEK